MVRVGNTKKPPTNSVQVSLRHYVGIDLGGTSIRLGMFTSDLTLLGTMAIPTRVAAGPSAVISDMKIALRALEAQCGVCTDIIGLGSSGPLDISRGCLCSLPNFPGWDGSFGLGDERGHVSVNPLGGLCSCGSIGCLELYASATGIVRMAHEYGLRSSHSARDLSAKDVADFARNGNKIALEFF